MPKGKFTPFTLQEEQKIKDEYLIKSMKGLARELGVSDTRIKRFLKINGLVIPRELIEQRIADSRKKKGDVPFNKGKKQTDFMTPEAIAKTKATRFKKGHLPFNSKRDGTISIREDTRTGISYKYIRVKKNVWDLYHRHIWEQHYGKIPEDMIVVFKDGDSLNTALENLELITMSENMLRNSKHNYPKEIIPTMVLMSKINNKLKQLEK